jgi:hypothetical protein
MTDPYNPHERQAREDIGTNGMDITRTVHPRREGLPGRYASPAHNVRVTTSSFPLAADGKAAQPTAFTDKQWTPTGNPPHIQTPMGRWRARRRAVLWRVGLLVLVVSLSVFVLYLNYSPRYHSAMSLAREGAQHLQNAERMIKNLTRGSLNDHGIAQLRQEFAAAYGDFNQLESALGQVPAIASAVPKYGSMLGAAERLVPPAIELSQAGMVGCDALTLVFSRLHEPLSAKAQGITVEDLRTIKHDVAEVQRLLNTAAAQVYRLQPSDLQVDSRVGPAIAAFRTALPKLQTGLQTFQTVLGVAPALLGISQPASFLVEQLDSTELRPGGGFIGSYGIVTFSGGRLASMEMRDTYLLDNAYTATGQKIPFPPAYNWFPLASSWSLRDSNLDANFPTAARYAEQIYHTEGGTNPLQGVIAITPWLIEGALKITGPIYVPEYHETITAQNLVDRIHFHQLKEEWKGGDVPSPDGHSSLRKRFTEVLFEHFFARVRQIWPTAEVQFVSLLRNSLSTKDLQIYFNSSAVEGLLQNFHLDSDIQAAPAGDGFIVVDANISGGKPNNFIHYTLQDRVTLDSSGNATHSTTLTYTWPVSANQFQNGFGHQAMYNDYARVYVPPGSTLVAQNGWVPKETSEAFGRKVWAGFFVLPYGQTKTISLTWAVPNAAARDATGWHYHYLIQRQAGIVWNLNLQVMLPSCARVVGSQGDLTTNGSPGEKLNRYLLTDLNVGVDYVC